MLLSLRFDPDLIESFIGSLFCLLRTKDGQVLQRRGGNRCGFSKIVIDGHDSAHRGGIQPVPLGDLTEKTTGRKEADWSTICRKGFF